MTPRKRNDGPKVHISLMISAKIWSQFELLLYDPVRRKPKFGEKSKVVEMLIRQYIEERSK